MMNLDLHEKHIKDKLGSQKVQVDVDQLWSAVEEFVPEAEQPRRRRFIWFWIFGAFVTGMITYQLATSSLQSDPLTSDVSSNSKQIAATPAVTRTIKNKTEAVIPGSETRNDNSNRIIEKKNNLEDIQNRTTTQINTSIERSVDLTKVTKSKGETLGYSNFSKGENDETRIINSSKSILAEADVASDQNNEIQRSVKELQLDMSQGESKDQILPTQQAIANRDESDFKEDITTVVPSNETIVAPADVQTMLNAVSRDPQLAFDKEVSPYKHASRWINGYSIQAGFGLGNVQYQSVNQEVEAMAQRLTDISTVMPELSVGASVYLPLFDRLTLETGIRYRRSVVRMTSDFELTTSSIEQGAAEILIDGAGKVKSITGDVETITNLTYDARHHSYLHQVDLPLTLNYELVNVRGWSMAARVGLVAGLYRTAKGYTLDQEFLHTSYDSSDSPYGSTLSLSPTYGCRVSKRLPVGIVAFIQADRIRTKFKYNTPNGLIEQQFNTVGIEVGTLIRL